MPITSTRRTRAYDARPVPNLDALPADALLTRAHVAAISTFPAVTLKQWAAKGKGPRVTMIEGRPRYRAADVRAWLNPPAVAA